MVQKCVWKAEKSLQRSSLCQDTAAGTPRLFLGQQETARARVLGMSPQGLDTARSGWVSEAMGRGLDFI